MSEVPYYEDDSVTIYHGDCREILPTVGFDRIITDPPYGVGFKYPSYVDSPENLKGLIADVKPYLINAAVFTGTRNMFFWPAPTWTLCWYEPGGTGIGPWGFTTWHPILVYGKDPFLIHGQGSRPDSFRVQATSSTRTATKEGTGGHVCPKPLLLMSQVVRRVSWAGETICDPFSGAGSTLRAAKDAGRHAIGIELDERACEIAAKRMCQEVLAT